MNYYEIVGSELQERGKRLNLSQQDLADTVNISRQSLSMYETGRNEIKLEIFVRICEALGTTPNEVLGFRSKIMTGEEFMECMTECARGVYMKKYRKY